VGTALLTRIPLMLDNPDWGPAIDPEHCFLLSAPDAYAKQRECSTAELPPLSAIDEGQIIHHYHLGSALMFHVTWQMYRVLGTRSLVVIKIFGTFLTLIFAALFTWYLRRMWGDRLAPVLVPIFLVAVPPALFMWVTLLPRGHHFENHLFYALFLPFVVLEAERSSSRASMILLGALGGLATAYTIANVLLLGTVLAFHVGLPDARATRRLVHRLANAAIALCSAAALFTLTGRSTRLLTRLRSSVLGIADPPDPVTASDLSFWQRGIDIARQLWLDNGVRLFSPHPWLPTHPTGRLEVVTGTIVMVVALAGFAALMAALVRIIALRHGTPNERFLAFNAVLVLVSFAAYVVVHPSWRLLGDPRYLILVYPPLFVGIGALCVHGLVTRTLVGRCVVYGGMALAGILLLAGWVDSYATNSAPRSAPADTSCDVYRLDYYFTDIPKRDHLSRVSGEALVAPGVLPADEDSPLCCEASWPGDVETCLFLRDLVRAEHLHVEFACPAAPDEAHNRCARAYGAVLGTCDPDAIADRANLDLCSSFTGGAFDACVSGAYMGSHYRDSWNAGCIKRVLDLCVRDFPEAPEHDACIEQVSAMMYGMPDLPDASADMPARCADWPLPWQGLCDRAHQLSAQMQQDAGSPCCEDVYLERFAEQLPDHAGWAYRSCRERARPVFPNCAVGVARSRGETECRWCSTAIPGFADYQSAPTPP